MVRRKKGGRRGRGRGDGFFFGKFSVSGYMVVCIRKCISILCFSLMDNFKCLPTGRNPPNATRHALMQH